MWSVNGCANWAFAWRLERGRADPAHLNGKSVPPARCRFRSWHSPRAVGARVLSFIVYQATPKDPLVLAGVTPPCCSWACSPLLSPLAAPLHSTRQSCSATSSPASAQVCSRDWKDPSALYRRNVNPGGKTQTLNRKQFPQPQLVWKIIHGSPSIGALAETSSPRHGVFARASRHSPGREPNYSVRSARTGSTEAALRDETGQHANECQGGCDASQQLEVVSGMHLDNRR